jgi:hypothetical protein
MPPKQPTSKSQGFPNMDLSLLNTTGNATLTLKHPTTGAELDITVECAGADSPAYDAAIKEIAKGNEEKHVKDWQADMLAKCVVGWTNVKENGKSVVCNADEIKRICKVYPWFREQIFAFMMDRANFLPKPEAD